MSCEHLFFVETAMISMLCFENEKPYEEHAPNETRARAHPPESVLEVEMGCLLHKANSIKRSRCVHVLLLLDNGHPLGI